MANFITDTAFDTATAATVEHSPRPPILVLRSWRNGLDVVLSKLKWKETSSIRQHCQTKWESDELNECLEKHELGLRNVTNVTKLHIHTLKSWD
mmetsp:Transcript_53754/g.61143  ORF Transcript_53754/g.61143 Transcript_53754/m.61143 type:complete len:94 (+) Transcript_53754:418-699(+)